MRRFLEMAEHESGWISEVIIKINVKDKKAGQRCCLAFGMFLEKSQIRLAKKAVGRYDREGVRIS